MWGTSIYAQQRATATSAPIHPLSWPRGRCGRGWLVVASGP
jgi:hypothetical protein